MKELKILGIVTFLTLALYWGVEPFAHSQMHPHVAPANFNFAQDDVDLAKHNIQVSEETVVAKKKMLDKAAGTDAETMASAQKAFNSAEKQLVADKNKLVDIDTFWKEIAQIDLSKGDATRGADGFMGAGCIGCHSMTSQGMPAPMSDEDASGAFGVSPPDLSTSGAIYDGVFLAALIKNPTRALNVSHKFNESKFHPMSQFYGLGGDMNQEIADIVAYLKSVAPSEVSNADVFKDACQRCHSMKYDKRLSNSNQEALAVYMGNTPPDLSIIIRAKVNGYLKTFINNPQKQLKGTAMPRVGLNEKSQEQVITYLENIGDSKKAERESLGIKVIAYTLLFTLLAYLWKVKIFREVH